MEITVLFCVLMDSQCILASHRSSTVGLRESAQPTRTENHG